MGLCRRLPVADRAALTGTGGGACCQRHQGAGEAAKTIAAGVVPIPV
jgi:hypothetical protein